MMFQLSACIDAMYTELDFYDRFAAAKQDGFDFVEFWSWTDRDLDLIKEKATACGVGISGFNGDADLSLIDPEQSEAYLAFLKKSLAAAKRVGSRSVTIHSNGMGDGGVILNDYRDLSDTVKICTMYENLKKAVALAEEAEVNLNLEGLNITTDHVGNYLTSTRMAAELTAMVGSPRLKILYDVYHMQLNEGSLCDNIKRYADQIGHVHVADAPGRHEPGTGEIHYPAVYACLVKSGYQGLIGFELFPETTTEAAVKAIMAQF